MRAEQHLEASFRAVLKNMNLPWPDKAVIEPSKDPKHGDLASNLALVSAKAAGMPPRELAAKMAEALRNEDASLASVEVAGPGFLNVTFSPEFWRETIRRIDDAADRFGQLGKAARYRWSTFRPTPPALSISVMAGARRWAIPWRASSVLPVMTSRRNTISTTLAARCGSLAFPFGCVPRNLPE